MENMKLSLLLSAGYFSVPSDENMKLVEGMTGGIVHRETHFHTY